VERAARVALVARAARVALVARAARVALVARVERVARVTSASEPSAFLTLVASNSGAIFFGISIPSWWDRLW
jgi:hypothetical protein